MKTAEQLNTEARRLNRRNARTTDVLKIMRAGNALHLEFRSGRPRWFLSNGCELHPDLAHVVIKDRHVICIGDALPFPGAPASQTWRHVSNS
jgi:hypothetical protein